MPPAHPVDIEDYERLADFRFALRTFLHFSESAAKEAGLTPQQHQALLAIKGAQRRGDMNIAALSARMLLRHHSVVELVNRLETGGYVVRHADPFDARKVVLGLSRKADGVLKRLAAAHMTELAKLKPLMGPLLVHIADSVADDDRP